MQQTTTAKQRTIEEIKPTSSEAGRLLLHEETLGLGAQPSDADDRIVQTSKYQTAYAYIILTPKVRNCMHALPASYICSAAIYHLSSD